MKVVVKYIDTDSKESEIMKSVDVMRWMNVSRATLYKMMKESGLPHKKSGHKFYFYKPYLVKWMQQQ